MKKIRKIKVSGSKYPMWKGNGLLSVDKKKVKKFVNPMSNAVHRLIIY